MDSVLVKMTPTFDKLFTPVLRQAVFASIEDKQLTNLNLVGAGPFEAGLSHPNVHAWYNR